MDKLYITQPLMVIKQDVDVLLESGSKIIVYDVEGNSNRYSVSDSRLKLEVSKTYEYGVGADGKLNCVNS